MNNKAAIIFGISGEQGQHVARGLLSDPSYIIIYGVTHSIEDHREAIERQLGVSVLPPLPHHADGFDVGVDRDTTTDKKQCIHLLEGNLSNAASLQRIFAAPTSLHSSNCSSSSSSSSSSVTSIDIFLVTATDLPPDDSTDASLHDCEEREYQTIKLFFDTLKDVHLNQNRNDNVGSNSNDNGRIERHVVFSTLENVRSLVEYMKRHPELYKDDLLTNMKPLDDGGIVPHFTGKGRGGEYALRLIHGVPDPWTAIADSKQEYGLLSLEQQSRVAVPSLIPGLTVTLITLPFLHSNFVASATPLPSSGGQQQQQHQEHKQPTQWSIEACLGDPLHPLDMFSISDLQYIVPVLFRRHTKYMGRNIRLSAEKISMEEISRQFADLFGKDVIYAPLTLEEMGAMGDDGGIPCVESLSQMCVYWSSEFGNRGDVEVTREIVAEVGREPQTFGDWLLTHSDEEAFERVGLTVDAQPINCVAVFNATCMQGKSVIKGLLADKRKEYTIHACICNDNDNESNAQANALLSLDPDRITIHHASQNDVVSCAEAVKGAEGVFVVTDFYNRHFPQLSFGDPERQEQEEKRVRNVIDACADSGTVRHIVFSTLESAEDVDNELQDADGSLRLDEEEVGGGKMFDSKVRIAAYARSKGLSVTYVLMPVYSEEFFHALATKMRNGDVILEESASSDEEEGGNRVVCMSVDELGPAVANVMDSYEVYAGHEIALMTDILSLKEASGIVNEVFFETKSATVTLSDGNTLEPSVTVIDTSSWATSIEGEDDVEYKRLDTFAKDLGSMFSFMNKSQAVKRRDAIAKTMALVPDVRTFRQWLEDNRDNVEFRAMLGIR